jgi:hypothetical protein
MNWKGCMGKRNLRPSLYSLGTDHTENTAFKSFVVASVAAVT